MLSHLTDLKRSFLHLQKLRYPVVLVYAKGKTGSVAITKATQKVYPGLSFHLHNLASRSRIERFLISSYRSWKPILVISPVRNVFDQSVSLFFQRNVGYITRKTTGRRLAPLGKGRDFTPEEMELHKTLSTDELINIYFHFLPEIINGIDDRYDTGVERWFDANIKHYFHIDVFSSPFPYEAGMKLYCHRHTKLLALQAELPDAVKENTIGKFVDCPAFKLLRENVGDQKYYSAAYSEFKKTIRFTPQQASMICNSRYFRHFYSPDFIEEQRARWLA